MELETMEDFYLKELVDVADGERQLLKALPKMAGAAVSAELRQTLETHLRETEEQLRRVEKILQEHGISERTICKGMQGILAEGQEFLDEDPDEGLIDVGLVTTAQKVEHYEIATYGCLTTYARLLGYDRDARQLYRILTEEKATDGKLSVLAEEAGLNEEAAAGETPEDMEAEEREEDENEPRPRSKRQTLNGGAKTASRGGGQNARRGSAQATQDIDEIRAWVEARGGKPAAVKSTAKGDDVGILRIDFPGYSGEGSLEEISWEQWQEKFEENNLTFLYQDQTKDGKESRFFKLVCDTPANAK
jgi:ferritin-like metal-binding protein YciE